MQSSEKMTHRGLLTQLVSYAPAIFFIVFLIGLVLHINIHVPLAGPLVGWIVGGIMLVVGPLLILWAQKARHTLYIPVENQTCANFNVGPYRISRHPTYLGLFILQIGFSFLIDSLPMLLMTLALVPLFTFVIIPKEESLLIELCKDVYIDYKKRVRMWL